MKHQHPHARITHEHRHGSSSHVHARYEDGKASVGFFLIPDVKRPRTRFNIVADDYAGVTIEIGHVYRVTRSTDTKVAGTRFRRPGKGRPAWRAVLAGQQDIHYLTQQDVRRDAVERLVREWIARGH